MLIEKPTSNAEKSKSDQNEAYDKTYTAYIEHDQIKYYPV